MKQGTILLPGLSEASAKRPHGKELQGHLGHESSPHVTAKRKWVSQSHNHKELNFAKSHMSLEKDFEL